ncbi:MAG: hypothetical protein HKN99_01550 [Winogradskyella sp.]|nr:hypothetical protein [Bacteroidia bacterium]NNC44551.1 hypothetical protein [Winogradskyella sp.]
MQSSKLGHIIKKIGVFGLIFVLVPLLLFSLVSGTEGGDNGIYDIIKNSPNAIPWVILIALLFLSKSRSKLAGVLITLIGIGVVYFFNFSGPNFWWITFIVTCLIPVFGLLILLSSYLNMP